jgi:hypothetical protein
MGQRAEKEIVILGKGVRSGLVSSVAVAEEDDPRRVVKGDLLGCFENLGQSPVCTGASAIEGVFRNRDG